MRVNKSEREDRELVKLRRTLLKSKVNKKSKTQDIRMEIQRLERVYSTYKDEIKRLERIHNRSKIDIAKEITNRIKILRIELDHRISGFNKPIKVVQGGRTGLKK